MKIYLLALLLSLSCEAAEVTSENWMEPPFNQWGFQNVSKVASTAEISKGSKSISFERDEKELSIPILEQTNTDGILVLHHGKIVKEEYFNSMKPETLHILWSGSKSILGTLSGILIEKGVLNPKKTVSFYVPELAASGYADATIQNLLDMNASLENRASDEFSSFKTDKDWDSYRFLLDLKKESNHGEVFAYTSPNALVLGWVVERVTNKHLPELISEKIWIPLGTEMEANTIVDRVGIAQPSGGFSVSLRDLGRFGQMILQKGNYNGNQIVPSAWIEDIRKNGNKEAFTKSDFASFLPGGYYRDMWWVNSDGSIMALGAYGQMLYIDFDADIVVAKFSSQPNASDGNLTKLTINGIRSIIDQLKSE